MTDNTSYINIDDLRVICMTRGSVSKDEMSKILKLARIFSIERISKKPLKIM